MARTMQTSLKFVIQGLLTFVFFSGYTLVPTKAASAPQYPYEIHSMVEMRALTNYFFRDLESNDFRVVSFALMKLEMMDETHSRLLDYIRKQLPGRVKCLNRMDNGLLVEFGHTLVRIGHDEDLKLLQSLTSTNMMAEHSLKETIITLTECLNRVKEGKPRFILHDKPYQPEEYPPETSPLSKPIPPLVVRKEEEPVPPPVKPLQQPTVKQSEPLSVHVEDRSWVLWLAVVIGGTSGAFLMWRKSGR